MFNLDTTPLLAKINEFTLNQQATLACLKAIHQELIEIKKICLKS